MSLTKTNNYNISKMANGTENKEKKSKNPGAYGGRGAYSGGYSSPNIAVLTSDDSAIEKAIFAA